MAVKPDEVLDLERRGVLNNGVFKLDLSPSAQLHAEKVRQEELKKQTGPVLAALPDGTAIVATPWVVEREKERIGREMAIERTLKTGANIAGGPSGAVGYGIAGDRGSDVGAFLDTGAMMFSPHPLNTQEVVNAPRDYRPYVWGAPTHEQQQLVESRAPETEPTPPVRVRPKRPVGDVRPKPSPQNEQMARAAEAAQSESASIGPMQKGTQNKLTGATPKASPLHIEEPRPGPLEGSLSAKPTAAPAREPRRIKISPVLPKEKTEKPKKGAEAAAAPPVTTAKAPRQKQAAAMAPAGAGGGAAGESEPASAEKPAAKPKGKAKASNPSAPKGGKIPSPQKLEKEVQRAVERDARSLPPADYVTFGDKNFESMVEQLRQLKQIYDKTGSAPVLSALERKDAAGNKIVDRTLKMSAPELMEYLDANGRPDLKTKFNALQEWAKDRPLAQSEIAEFLSGGPLATRRPDTVMLRFRAAQGAPLLSITDTTRKETPESFVVHEFKTFFYGEAFSAVLDLKPAMSESFEHNPKLGIHRPALSGGPLGPERKTAR
jgi:hypothetical protein